MVDQFNILITRGDHAILFQSCPGRGTNSLSATSGGGGRAVGVRVLVGGAFVT